MWGHQLPSPGLVILTHSCSPFQQHPSKRSSERSFTQACFHILASLLCSPSFNLARNKELHTWGATGPVTVEEMLESKHPAFSTRTTAVRDTAVTNPHTNTLSQEICTTVRAGKPIPFWVEIEHSLHRVILTSLCLWRIKLNLIWGKDRWSRGLTPYLGI